MTISVEEARTALAEYRSKEYPSGADFQVATWGRENADYFLIRSGAYAEVYPPRTSADLDYLVPDDNVYLVDKETGSVVVNTLGLYPNDSPFVLPDATAFGTPQDAP